MFGRLRNRGACGRHPHAGAKAVGRRRALPTTAPWPRRLLRTLRRTSRARDGSMRCRGCCSSCVLLGTGVQVLVHTGTATAAVPTTTTAAEPPPARPSSRSTIRATSREKDSASARKSFVGGLRGRRRPRAVRAVGADPRSPMPTREPNTVGVLIARIDLAATQTALRQAAVKAEFQRRNKPVLEAHPASDPSADSGVGRSRPDEPLTEVLDQAGRVALEPAVAAVLPEAREDPKLSSSSAPGPSPARPGARVRVRRPGSRGGSSPGIRRTADTRRPRAATTGPSRPP